MNKLNNILEAVRIGGWYDANPNLREPDYMDTDVAADSLKSLIKELIHSAPSLTVEQEDELTALVDNL